MSAESANGMVPISVAASRLGVSATRIREAVRAGRLPSQPGMNGRHPARLVDIGATREVIAGRRPPLPDVAEPDAARRELVAGALRGLESLPAALERLITDSQRRYDDALAALTEIAERLLSV